MWESALTDEQCDEIIASGLTQEAKKATTFRSDNDDHRKTQVRWLQPDDFPEIHDIVAGFAVAANEHFKLEIDSLPYLQFTEYIGEGYKYDDHHDVDWDRQDGQHRKISVIIQLSDPDDYEGGEFRFITTENPDGEKVKKRGTVIAFVSYYEHAVFPLSSGNRTSLVAWVEGPRWR
jgi:PKHD-type hydroxylase